jgi:enoyl-CoA hydratase/carnithine racemase
MLKICSSALITKIVRRFSSKCLLSVSDDDGIRSITLDDHKTRNSLSISMMNQLIDEIKRDENDKNLRIIVLQSTGLVFSAGHNLKELAPEKSYEDQKSVFDKCHELINTIIQSPVPIIAKVDGLAAGECFVIEVL